MDLVMRFSSAQRLAFLDLLPLLKSAPARYVTHHLLYAHEGDVCLLLVILDRPADGLHGLLINLSEGVGPRRSTTLWNSDVMQKRTTHFRAPLRSKFVAGIPREQLPSRLRVEVIPPIQLPLGDEPVYMGVGVIITDRQTHACAWFGDLSNGDHRPITHVTSNTTFEQDEAVWDSYLGKSRRVAQLGWQVDQKEFKSESKSQITKGACFGTYSAVVQINEEREGHQDVTVRARFGTSSSSPKEWSRSHFLGAAYGLPNVALAAYRNYVCVSSTIRLSEHLQRTQLFMLRDHDNEITHLAPLYMHAQVIRIIPRMTTVITVDEQGLQWFLAASGGTREAAAGGKSTPSDILRERIIPGLVSPLVQDQPWRVLADAGDVTYNVPTWGTRIASRITAAQPSTVDILLLPNSQLTEDQLHRLTAHVRFDIYRQTLRQLRTVQWRVQGALDSETQTLVQFQVPEISPARIEAVVNRGDIQGNALKRLLLWTFVTAPSTRWTPTFANSLQTSIIYEVDMRIKMYMHELGVVDSDLDSVAVFARYCDMPGLLRDDSKPYRLLRNLGQQILGIPKSHALLANRLGWTRYLSPETAVRWVERFTLPEITDLAVIRAPHNRHAVVSGYEAILPRETVPISQVPGNLPEAVSIESLWQAVLALLIACSENNRFQPGMLLVRGDNLETARTLQIRFMRIAQAALAKYPTLFTPCDQDPAAQQPTLIPLVQLPSSVSLSPIVSSGKEEKNESKPLLSSPHPTRFTPEREGVVMVWFPDSVTQWIEKQILPRWSSGSTQQLVTALKEQITDDFFDNMVSLGRAIVQQILSPPPRATASASIWFDVPEDSLTALALSLLQRPDLRERVLVAFRQSWTVQDDKDPAHSQYWCLSPGMSRHTPATLSRRATLLLASRALVNDTALVVSAYPLADVSVMKPDPEKDADVQMSLEAAKPDIRESKRRTAVAQIIEKEKKEIKSKNVKSVKGKGKKRKATTALVPSETATKARPAAALPQLQQMAITLTNVSYHEPTSATLPLPGDSSSGAGGAPLLSAGYRFVLELALANALAKVFETMTKMPAEYEPSDDGKGHRESKTSSSSDKRSKQKNSRWDTLLMKVALVDHEEKQYLNNAVLLSMHAAYARDVIQESMNKLVLSEEQNQERVHTLQIDLESEQDDGQKAKDIRAALKTFNLDLLRVQQERKALQPKLTDAEVRYQHRLADVDYKKAIDLVAYIPRLVTTAGAPQQQEQEQERELEETKSLVLFPPPPPLESVAQLKNEVRVKNEAMDFLDSRVDPIHQWDIPLVASVADQAAQLREQVQQAQQAQQGHPSIEWKGSVKLIPKNHVSVLSRLWQVAFARVSSPSDSYAVFHQRGRELFELIFPYLQWLILARPDTDGVMVDTMHEFFDIFLATSPIATFLLSQSSAVIRPGRYFYGYWYRFMQAPSAPRLLAQLLEHFPVFVDLARSGRLSSRWVASQPSFSDSDLSVRRLLHDTYDLHLERGQTNRRLEIGILSLYDASVQRVLAHQKMGGKQTSAEVNEDKKEIPRPLVLAEMEPEMMDFVFRPMTLTLLSMWLAEEGRPLHMSLNDLLVCADIMYRAKARVHPNQRFSASSNYTERVTLHPAIVRHIHYFQGLAQFEHQITPMCLVLLRDPNSIRFRHKVMDWVFALDLNETERMRHDRMLDREGEGSVENVNWNELQRLDEVRLREEIRGYQAFLVKAKQDEWQEWYWKLPRELDDVSRVQRIADWLLTHAEPAWQAEQKLNPQQLTSLSVSQINATVALYLSGTQGYERYVTERVRVRLAENDGAVYKYWSVLRTRASAVRRVLCAEIHTVFTNDLSVSKQAAKDFCAEMTSEFVPGSVILEPVDLIQAPSMTGSRHEQTDYFCGYGNDEKKRSMSKYDLFWKNYQSEDFRQALMDRPRLQNVAIAARDPGRLMQRLWWRYFFWYAIHYAYLPHLVATKPQDSVTLSAIWMYFMSQHLSHAQASAFYQREMAPFSTAGDFQAPVAAHGGDEMSDQESPPKTSTEQLSNVRVRVNKRKSKKESKNAFAPFARGRERVPARGRGRGRGTRGRGSGSISGSGSGSGSGAGSVAAGPFFVEPQVEVPGFTLDVVGISASVSAEQGREIQSWSHPEPDANPNPLFPLVNPEYERAEILDSMMALSRFGAGGGGDTDVLMSTPLNLLDDLSRAAELSRSQGLQSLSAAPRTLASASVQNLSTPVVQAFQQETDLWTQLLATQRQEQEQEQQQAVLRPAQVDLIQLARRVQ